MASEESGKGTAPPEQQGPIQPRSWLHQLSYGP